MEKPIKPTFSVVILMFHRTQELVDMAKECVSSVLNSRPKNTELIIVNNGSTVNYDWSMADAYIKTTTNRGCAGGWNLGINASRGDYINVIGDDTIVQPGWLDKMKNALNMPMAGVSNVHVEHLPHGVGVVEKYKWFSGACFMLPRRTIQKIGLFDERFYPVNYEDVDYWTRLLRSGLKMYVDYSMTIQHKEGQTVHAKDISEHNDENRKRYIEKWGFDPLPYFYQGEPFPMI